MDRAEKVIPFILYRYDIPESALMRPINSAAC